MTETPYQYALTKYASGRLMALLFVACGLLTCAATVIPGTIRDPSMVVIIGCIAALFGVIFWFLPWRRFPRWVMVVGPVPLALGLIASHNYFAADAYRYSLFFSVSYIWIGLTQRQGVGILILPFTTAAYVMPLLALHQEQAALSSSIYLIPILVLLGESIAWISHRLASVQTRLEHLAYHDGLTGMFNRAYFYQILEDVVKTGVERDTLALVLLVDLNDFKSVNDQFGHAAGDILLHETAKVLESATHGHGVWARLGGDEFGCIVPELGTEEAAHRFTQMVRSALETPILVDGTSFRVGASVGYSVIPKHGANAKDLMVRADAAVYLDKSQPTAIDTHSLDKRASQVSS